jgi:hypothetical protein
VDLPDIKELKALLKLCRSQGVTNLTLGSLVVSFGDLPREPGNDTEQVEVNATVPTDAEMAFWSVQTDPQAAAEATQTEISQ